ncbi:MAG TPA: hypothetical protein VGF67_03060 [Ktedonobacteraceae bacterium]
MNRKTAHLMRLITLCSLSCMAVALAACGLGGSSSNLSPLTTGNSHTLPSTGSFSGATRLYTGTGISIKYPANWVINTGGNGADGGGVRFSEPGTSTTFTLEILPVPFFSDSAPAGAVKSLIPTLQKEGSQTQTVPIASTTTVGGQTWNQSAGTTVVTQGGQPVSIEQVMLATNHPIHPPGSRVFVLTYTASAQTFEQIDTSVFLPMLQSFKFTR